VKALKESGAAVASVGDVMSEHAATKADLQALEQRMMAHMAGRFETLHAGSDASMDRETFNSRCRA
jgi:hypothetical protein